MDAITQLISTVGFPIVMCLLMYFQNKNTIENMKSSIDENTKALKELLQKLGGEWYVMRFCKRFRKLWLF